MTWEYKMLEPMDYGHPGSGPRFQEFTDEVTKLCNDGWELVHLVPSMMRGRKVSGGREDTITMTTVAMAALMRRKVE